MNKQSYKKAALEHGDFQSPVQATQRRTMAHAFLFMDGTEPDRIMHILNMALVEILSPKIYFLMENFIDMVILVLYTDLQ
jgi:hypothetical protein